MNNETKQALLAYLGAYVSENKRAKIARLVLERTRHVTVVLENIFLEHNASAVLRSAECFGVQDIHIVEQNAKFKATNGVCMGAAKWLDLHRYEKINDCFLRLRSNGYKIVATTPSEGACLLHDFPLNQKFALVFGTENAGLTSHALAHADQFVKIPMFGFTKSFNVSVSVALCLYHFVTALRSSNISWHLSDQEVLDLTLAWYRKAVPASRQLEGLFSQERLHEVISQ